MTDTNSKKLCIATPMYGGNAKSAYTTSVANLIHELAQRGWSVAQIHIGNESLITRARNSLVHNFLALEGYAGLLFIDSDHGFNSKEVADMVESGKDLIGGIYPMKGINWAAVRKAALLGKEDLEAYSGQFAINLLDEPQDFNYRQPFKVRDIGTGMMYISRKVFEELAPVCKTYKANGLGQEVAIGQDVVEYFTTMIDEDGILLSEDYAFCKMWRDQGNDVWAAPWVRLTHIGDYTFKGSFAHTLELAQEQISEPDPAS